jgi:hypothetical protein
MDWLKNLNAPSGLLLRGQLLVSKSGNSTMEPILS